MNSKIKRLAKRLINQHQLSDNAYMFAKKILAIDNRENIVTADFLAPTSTYPSNLASKAMNRSTVKIEIFINKSFFRVQNLS